jgi:hypothetical protein
MWPKATFILELSLIRRDEGGDVHPDEISRRTWRMEAMEADSAMSSNSRPPNFVAIVRSFLGSEKGDGGATGWTSERARTAAAATTRLAAEKVGREKGLVGSGPTNGLLKPGFFHRSSLRKKHLGQRKFCQISSVEPENL